MFRVLLADERQPAVLVGPSGIAGLKQTKKILIIPSGALSNTAESAFFKAVVAEFATSGGVIVCMTQRTGIDFSALPVPAGRSLKAVGWNEESGSLFRASTIQIKHPLFTNIAGPAPAMERIGYFTAYPSGSRVLLSRTDGFPTVIAYQYEKGWVVATTLLTDVSKMLGSAEPDEKTFIRNLLAWAQNPVDGSEPTAIDSMQADPAGRSAGQTMPSLRLQVRTHAERKDNLVKLLSGPAESRPTAPATPSSAAR